MRLQRNAEGGEIATLWTSRMDSRGRQFTFGTLCRTQPIKPFDGITIMLSRRKLLSAAVASSAVSLGFGVKALEAADDSPTRLIRLIVGYATGGNVDVPARLFAPELQRILGVPVIIENRPGASGITAAETVASMAPGGYNIIWGPYSSQ